MAQLTLAEFRTEVQLACRNMPTSDPYYGAAAALIDRYILRARNELIRMAIDKGRSRFPELRYDATIGPTVAGQGRIARPSAFLLIDRITKQGASTAITSWDVVREQPVTFRPLAEFTFLAKNSATGYATIWTREGADILFYPTADSSHVDYFHGFGFRRETLASNGPCFVGDEFWDDPTIMLAASRIQERRGWFSRSRELYDRVVEILDSTADMTGMEEIGQQNTISIEGAPSRSSTYGR